LLSEDNIVGRKAFDVETEGIGSSFRGVAVSESLSELRGELSSFNRESFVF